MAAAQSGHASVCTLLIEREAHVDCQDNVSMHGKTAMSRLIDGSRTLACDEWVQNQGCILMTMPE